LRAYNTPHKRSVKTPLKLIKKAPALAEGEPELACRLRHFHLHRTEDPTGVSGTGCVAEGVVFSNGWVAMTWHSAQPSMNFYTSIEQVEAIHGHSGTTRVVFHGGGCDIDEEARTRSDN
jgi:hypothetical protein